MARNTVVVSILSDTKQLSKGFKDTDGIFSKLGRTAKGLTKVAAGTAVAVAGVGLALGWKRLQGLDSARTKMTALGLEGKEVDAAMNAALASVRGTSFGLADAADVATLAMGAGIRDADRLEDSLTAVSIASAIGRTGLGEMGNVFNGVWARGRVTMKEINQLNTRGIAIQGMLSESLGVTTGELEGMISQGLVSAEDLEAAFLANAEAARIMGDDIAGRASNSLAALGRLGAGVLAPFFEHVKTGMGETLVFLWGIEDRLAPIFGAWNEKMSAAFNLEGAGERLLAGIDRLLGITQDAEGTFSFDITGALQSGVAKGADWLASGGVVALVEGFMSGRQALLDGLLQVFPVIVDALVSILPLLVSTVVSMVPSLLDGALLLFTTLLDAVVLIAPGLVTQLLGMLPGIVGSLLGMVPDLLNTAIKLFTSLVAAIPKILPPLIAAIVDTLPKLVDTVLGMIPGILDAAIELFTALVEAIPVIVPQLISAIITLLPMITTTVIGMIPRLLTAAVQLFTGIVTAIPKIIPELIPALLHLLPEIIGALIGMIPELVKAGVDLIGGLVKGLWEAGSAVGKALLDIVKGAVSGFLSFLGIKSPSKLFARYGDDLGDGLIKGITGSARGVKRAMSGLSGAVVDGFDASLDSGELKMSVSSSGTEAGGVRNYQITVNALAPSPEIGRTVVEAIEEYERLGGVA